MLLEFLRVSFRIYQTLFSRRTGMVDNSDFMLPTDNSSL
jgi:hypothetical protein